MLKAMGAQVEWRTLTRGDYVVGPETVVERKTVAGLHASLVAGRFWHQMRKVRAAGRSPYLVIEGPSVFRGPVKAKSVRGLCLAVSDLGITIIRTESPVDTSAWLMALASRRRQGAIRDRPIYA
jgi:DNA excision repair protein ERCC-4